MTISSLDRHRLLTPDGGAGDAAEGPEAGPKRDGGLMLKRMAHAAAIVLAIITPLALVAPSAAA